MMSVCVAVPVGWFPQKPELAGPDAQLEGELPVRQENGFGPILARRYGLDRMFVGCNRDNPRFSDGLEEPAAG